MFLLWIISRIKQLKVLLMNIGRTFYRDKNEEKKKVP